MNLKTRNLSLRSKMVLGGILLVAVPLLIVGTVTFLNSSRTLENISKRQTVQIAISLSSMIQIAIEKERNFIVATAGDALIKKAVATGDYDSLRQKLIDLYAKAGAEYEDFAIFDQAGVIRVEAVDQKRVGISVAEREYARQVRKGTPGIGSVTPSKATGRPIFGIAAPITSPEGKYLGGFVGVVKADFLMKYVLSLKLGQSGYATLIDRKGIIIAHPNPDFILKLDTLNDVELRDNTKK